MAKILCLHSQSELDFHSGSLSTVPCIEDSNHPDYVVYSDSFSCLQAAAGLKTDYPFVAKVIHKMNQLASDGYDIHLCWVPCHANIKGNECVDWAVKKALNCDVM